MNLACPSAIIRYLVVTTTIQSHLKNVFMIFIPGVQGLAVQYTKRLKNVFMIYIPEVQGLAVQYTERFLLTSI